MGFLAQRKTQIISRDLDSPIVSEIDQGSERSSTSGPIPAIQIMGLFHFKIDHRIKD